MEKLKKRIINIDDIVLIIDEIKLYRGIDDLIRVVDLKTSTSILQRPVHKLILLERLINK